MIRPRPRSPRKPWTYAEWRCLFQDRLYWLGTAAETWFSTLYARRDYAAVPYLWEKVHVEGGRRIYYRVQQLKRIEARMDEAREQEERGLRLLAAIFDKNEEIDGGH